MLNTVYERHKGEGEGGGTCERQCVQEAVCVRGGMCGRQHA